LKLSRTDRSLFAEWWFTVDRQLLAAILVLIGAGFMLSLAASPAVALHKGLGEFYFVKRHAVFAVAAIPAMVALSVLRPAQIRRISLVLFAAMFGLVVFVLNTGPEINGARRWLDIAGQQLQPSELLKPAFVILAAWLFAQTSEQPKMPALPLAIALFLATATVLVMQPDIGQTLLLTLVWGALFFLSGQPLRRMAIVLLAGMIAIAAAYATLPHVRSRIDRFVNPAVGDTYQMDRARDSIIAGGLLGRGPGEGQLKMALPDAHTDYVLAVIAEEYGALACLGLVATFAFVVFRALAFSWRERDPFLRNAATGLALLLGVQVLINVGVSAGLLPSKGMTLPFISYGGSSIMGVAMGMGMLLAVTRRWPDAVVLEMARDEARIGLEPADPLGVR
jgi:cell division protein FtsW